MSEFLPGPAVLESSKSQSSPLNLYPAVSCTPFPKETLDLGSIESALLKLVNKQSDHWSPLNIGSVVATYIVL